MPTASEKKAAMKKAAPKGKLSLDAAIAKVKKEQDLDFGELPEFERMSSGNIALDYVMGGGFPKGLIVEAYGLQSSGKTTAALQLAAKEQQAGHKVIFLDYEQSLDPVYCKTLGLDIMADSFLSSQPDTFEQGMNALGILIPTGEVSLVIVDSVAAMVVEKELESDAGGIPAFQKARMMAAELRKLGPALRENGTCIVFLNHVRDVIDMSPIGQKLAGAGVQRKTTPGGGALKFAAAIRLLFKVKKQIHADRYEPLANEDVKTAIGAYVEVKAEKNKTGMPYRKADMMLRYGTGFSAGWTVLQVLVSRGSIKKKSGGVYEFDEDTQWTTKDGATIDTIRGEDNVVQAIEEHPEWLEHLIALAERSLEERSEFVAVEVEEEVLPDLEAAPPSADTEDIDALLGVES